MRTHRTRLGAAEVSPERMLRRLAARARTRGLPDPAALIGDWFGSAAVLVPSVRPVPLGSDAPDTLVPALPAPDGLEPAGDGAIGGFVGGGFVGRIDHPARPGLPPRASWGRTSEALRHDGHEGWWYEALLGDAPTGIAEAAARAAAQEFEALLRSDDPPQARHRVGELRTPDAGRHRKAVAACIEAIAAGEIFQANICSRFAVDFLGDPIDLFAQGSATLHPARAAFLPDDATGSVISFSPELFLARHGDLVRSAPIKGTLPRRGPDDDGNAARLRASTKDVAENVMIVDLVRNDLGRVAHPGGVRVPELLAVQPHPGVWHLVSTVSATLRPGTSHAELLAATFPPGSVTGTPKIRALEIIDELEAEPRGLHCGAVGMISPIAGLELNVAIRTFEQRGGELVLGVGGGITADSDPDAEWAECLTKAAPLLALLGR
ncbi:para-aminobenzoate synthetase component 1 [Actinoalloteichus hoggarensis]|uniref:Aminodeoxychorismate synthase component 1 n=1 Tax=Actinoalloteichus hoggarensis TaxID=1470176 RepID=A0A221VXS6_9PSEU|nr:aminodeoxychorismate synthase component I [Actinoalloteichus hoggarensis]ASO18314.1 Aminodeoxychorismate synthase component 1 [Actinoalloteichus hoggarensis]MBB5921676.1 para-aminobenzoate synthetase component 1 [Actinoalloteichus hoggarensis]